MAFVLPSQMGAPGVPPMSTLPTSTVELSLKCDNLPDKDLTSKSDPVAVLFKKTKNGSWLEVGRTEMIRDTLNPQWQKRFIVDYSFEERQVIKVEVYDWDDDTTQSLDRQDFLGRCEMTLGSVVAAKGGQFASYLQGGKKGRLVMIAEELGTSKETLKMQFAAKSLDKKDLFGKSDPFFVISKTTSSGQSVVVYRSEVIKNDLNPTWKPFQISARDLCNNDYDRPLIVDVYDWDSDGSHDVIGSFRTDLKMLSIAMVEQKRFQVINEKKKSKKSYKNSGEVYLKSYQSEQEISFLDYIQGGTSMNFTVAVDFTASNGDPRDQRSLHYINPNYGDNQYTLAIKSVGGIIEDYDTDKLFPGLGFGARIPPNNVVSHEFFMNLHPENPYCSGVQGLLEAYQRCVQSVTLYGPTNFAPVIRHVSRFAQAYKDGKQYFVLLILTDGIITDLEETKAAIIQASTLPMSIIIVGVGNEDFSAMNELDSDDRILRHQGLIAARDIVQFVQMNRFVTGNGQWDKEMLAKDVLAEIPKQMVGWMKINGIRPGMG